MRRIAQGLRWAAYAGLVLLAAGEVAYGGTHGVERVRFLRYGVEDGLPQTTVRTLAQDADGFVWMGTQDGLARFDGYEFRVHRYDPTDPTSIGDNHVTALAADPDGSLWIGTQAGGVSRFDPALRTFQRLPADPSRRSALAGNPVTELRRDSRGRYWVGSGAGHLQWLDPATGTFTHVPLSQRVALGGVRAVRERSDHDFLIGARSGLWHVNADGVLRRELRGPDGAALDVYDVVEAPDQTLWVATATIGLLHLREDGTPLRHVRASDGLADDVLRALLLDRAGRLWVGTYDGLSRLDSADATPQNWHADAARSDSVSANRIHALMQDRSGLIWIGTWLNGVSLFNPRTEVFVEIRAGRGEDGSLPGVGVPGVYVDADDTLWLGVLEGGGLVHFDLERGMLARYIHDPDDPSSLPNNHAQCITRDRSGALWVGTVGGGLARLRPDERSFDVFRHDPADPGSVGSDAIWSLYVDSRGTLWVGTLDSGLSSLCAGCTRFEHFRDDPSDSSALGGEVVNAMLEDSRGEFWIGLRPGGLVRLDRERGRAEHFRPEPGKLGMISHDNVTAITEARDGELWIGTQGGGLNRARRQADGSLAFTSYTRRDGLGGDAIGGIVQDRSGKIWISTISGLSRIDPGNGTIENFGARDGVQGSGYFINAYATMADGSVVFGGLRGATVFDPSRVLPVADAGEVVITEYRTFRSRGSRDEPPFRIVRGPGGASVDMRQGVDDFSAEFASLSFAAPAAVQYAYRLDGYDPDWIATDARRRFASYNNLAPGNYVLRVRARPAGGAWSAETRLPIRLPTPWWRTSWAKAGYTLLALGLLLTFLWQARARVLERGRAQRELAASEERLKLALWGTGDELWDMDLRTGELFRESPLQHLEYPPLKYLPDSSVLRKFLHPDDVEPFDRALREQILGKTDFVDVSYRARDRNGHWRWLRSRGRVTRRDEDGHAWRLTGTTEDVTEIKEHEHMLERINLELERRVGERTTDLTVANDNLRNTIEQLRLTQRQLVDSEKMAALGGLVAGVAHEINTPLGIGVTAASHLDVEVKRLTKLLDRDALKRSDLEHFQRSAHDSAQLILRNLQRADKLIRSFKQVAVDQSSEQRRRINLKGYLGEILTSLHPALKKTRHEVEVEAPDDLELETFPGAIYQIIVNLVMNSLIHGFEGVEHGHIRIGLAREAGEVVLRYADDGRGMPPEVSRRVFEPFFTTRRGQGGSGLGMHIAYNLAVQVLRGSITCDSEPGKGVRFVVRIPASTG